MQGIYLKFYAYEFEQHHGMLLYEWLLEFAKKQGIKGGSAFRGIAGYGRHGQIHVEHFFELSANVPVVITFVISEEVCSTFLELLKKEKINLFYIKIPVEHGSLLENSSPSK